jgi:branched-chain amino acid aminotransferase
MVTPPADSGCRNEVFRNRILAMGRTDRTYTWEERAVSPFELQQADEIFIAGVVFGIRSVTEYRKARFGVEAASYLTAALNKIVQEEGF